MGRRKRRGRFHREIRRHTAEEFNQALEAFAAAINVRADQFKPAGLPQYPQMVHRARLYPDFAEAFTAARMRRIDRLSEKQPEGTDPLTLALQKLEHWSGSLRDFTGQGCLSYETLRAHSKEDREFDRRFRDALAKRASRFGSRRRYSAVDYDHLITVIERTTARSKNEFSLQARPGIPSFLMGQARASKDAEYGARFNAAIRARGWDQNFYDTEAGKAAQAQKQLGRGYAFLKEARERLLQAISEGSSIGEFCSIESNPSVMTVWRYCRAVPEYAAQLKSAKKQRRTAKIADRAEAPRQAKPVYQTELLKGQLGNNALFAAADKALRATKRAIDDQDRFDIIANMIEAALAGDIAMEDMAEEAPFFISEYNRQMGAFRTLSLNEKRKDGEGSEMDGEHIEGLTSDHYSYAE